MPLVRYFAAARAAAGTAEEELPGATLEGVLRAAAGSRDTRFAEVLAVCSVLVDGDPVGQRDHATVLLAPASVVECLPPFAGG